MSMTHQEIQTILPEYLAAALPPASADEVRTHIASCSDCQEELGVLVELQRLDVADPGESFWKTLPGRVAREARASDEKDRDAAGWAAWLWRPVPLAGALLLLAILIVARLASPPAVVSDGAMSAEVYGESPDYDGVAESDIPDIELDGEAAAALARMQGDLDGYAYHSDLVALKTGEMERFSRAVQRYNPRGG